MSSPESGRRPGVAATLALYTLSRIGLVTGIALLLVLAGVPLMIAALVGLIVALPLSMVLFRGMRARLDEAIATAGARRSAEREALRARLRGDEPADRDEPVDPEPVDPESVDPGRVGSEQRAADQQPQPEPYRGER